MWGLRIRSSPAGRKVASGIALRMCLSGSESASASFPRTGNPLGLGESVATETDRIEWMPPGRAAIALGIPIPTLTAWYRRAVGLPFIWIGGRGQHKYMY